MLKSGVREKILRREYGKYDKTTGEPYSNHVPATIPLRTVALFRKPIEKISIAAKDWFNTYIYIYVYKYTIRLNKILCTGSYDSTVVCYSCATTCTSRSFTDRRMKSTIKLRIPRNLAYYAMVILLSSFQ